MIQIKIEKVIATFEDDKLLSISLQEEKTHSMIDFLCSEVGFEEKQTLLEKIAKQSEA